MTIFRDVYATALLATAFANRESPRVTLHTSINGCHTLVKKSTDPLNFDDGTRSMSLPLRQQHADFIIKTRQTMQFCNDVYVRVYAMILLEMGSTLVCQVVLRRSRRFAPQGFHRWEVRCLVKADGSRASHAFIRLLRELPLVVG